MSHVRRAIAGAVCAAAVAMSLLSSASPPAAGTGSTVGNAIDYLASQQIAGNDPATGSGAWDTDPGFAFTTPDAVLAIAEAAQTGTTWSTSEALAAVTAFTNPQSQNPLAFVALMEAATSVPGDAAFFIVMVAAPLGMDTTALEAIVGDPAPGGYFDSDLYLNETLWAGLSKKITAGSVPASTVAYVESKQKPSNGGWSWDADTGTVTDAEVDTTALAIQMLIAGGVAPTDPVIVRALHFLAVSQNPNGSWSFLGNESAESTESAMLAIAAAGYDVNDRYWRDVVAPELSGQPFVGADAALLAMVQPDGSIAGPGVWSAPYATASAVVGLERTWLPVTRAPAQVPPAPPAPAVNGLPRFTG